MMMSNNLETFRAQFLDSMRDAILQTDPVSATPTEMILQSACLKAYDYVDQYLGLTPERTAMILAMSVEDFATWIELPRNQYAFAATLEDPVAAGIIARDDSAPAIIAASGVAMVILAASATAMTAVAASSTAMNALAASAIAMTAVEASAVATEIVLASATAMTAVAASSVAMGVVVASTSATNALVASATAMAAVAASSVAMEIVVASASTTAAVVASTTAMTAVAASSVAMGVVAANATTMNAVLASAAATDTIIANGAALAAIAANSIAMGVVATNASALNKMAKSASARIYLAGSPFLQDHAVAIKTTLTNASTSLFTRRANGGAQTSVYNTQYGYVGLDKNGAYRAEILNSGTTSNLLTGKVFVFIRTMGNADDPIRAGAEFYSVIAYHVQTSQIAGQKPVTENYQTQEANLICIGGLRLVGNMSYSYAHCGMIYDVWEAV
jgi:hypothetical protein